MAEAGAGRKRKARRAEVRAGAGLAYWPYGEFFGASTRASRVELVGYPIGKLPNFCAPRRWNWRGRGARQNPQKRGGHTWQFLLRSHADYPVVDPGDSFTEVDPGELAVSWSPGVGLQGVDDVQHLPCGAEMQIRSEPVHG